VRLGWGSPKGGKKEVKGLTVCVDVEGMMALVSESNRFGSLACLIQKRRPRFRKASSEVLERAGNLGGGGQLSEV
jgi:hypothetical protein